MTRIKLMTDYRCWPLWDEETYENIDPKSLPITEVTSNQLIAWADTYDSILNEEDPVTSAFPSEEEKIAFDNEGIALWHQLQRELGSEYAVRYFSYIKRHVISST